MKRIISYALFIILCLATQAQTYVSTVEEVLSTPWKGFGYNQWGFARESDGNTFKPWDDALWQTTQERILAIRPSLVRLPLMRAWFNTDDNGNPLPVGTYNWNSKYMQSYFKIMDLYKENNIKVMCGLWHSTIEGTEGDFYGSDDFAKLQSDLIEYLFKTKGYDKIITCYAPTNEPLGCSVSYSMWSTMCKKLYAELGNRGLPTNIILGADSWGDWIWKPAQENKDQLSGYDFHCYLNDTPDDTYNQLYKKTIETTFSNNIANIRKYDSSSKPVHVSEMAPIGVPYIDWPVSTAPAHCRIDTYEYALGFWDYGIQLARSGMSSGLAWGLDGFEQNKNAGMWNNAGTYGGMTLRPWYYTWQLMCRYFPGNAKILKMTEPSNRKDLRILGARINNDDYTFVIVNRRIDEQSKTQNVTIKINSGAKTFYVYNFNRNECGNGMDLSIPYTVKEVNNLQQDGIELEIGLESGVLVTTLPPLENSGKTPVSDLNIDFEDNVNYTLLGQSNYGASIMRITNPRKRDPNTSDMVCQADVKNIAGEPYDAGDSYAAIIPLDRIKIPADKPYLDFQTYKSSPARITVGICFEDIEGMKGYTFEAQGRNWQQNQIDLSGYSGKVIKYIALFPDRYLAQSISTQAYLSIDNITLTATPDDPQQLTDIVFNDPDHSVTKKLNIDFENLGSGIAPSGGKYIESIQIVTNPKTGDENSSEKVCRATLLATSSCIDADNSKVSLNPYPAIKVIKETPHLFFQVFRQNNAAECALEIEFKSGKKLYKTFSVAETRQWKRFGVDVSEYADEIITNISVYPNINYSAESTGISDISHYDNFILSDEELGAVENVGEDTYKVFVSYDILNIIGAEDSSVSIYGIDGRTIYLNGSIGSNFELPVEKGIYLVRVNNKVYKIKN